MTSDRDLIIEAMEEAQRILADHLEPGSLHHPTRTIHRLVMVLDRPEVAAALERMKANRGLRVVK
jgi:hypothetical protein